MTRYRVTIETKNSGEKSYIPKVRIWLFWIPLLYEGRPSIWEEPFEWPRTMREAIEVIDRHYEKAWQVKHYVHEDFERP